MTAGMENGRKTACTSNMFQVFERPRRKVKSTSGTMTGEHGSACPIHTEIPFFLVFGVSKGSKDIDGDTIVPAATPTPELRDSWGQLPLAAPPVAAPLVACVGDAATALPDEVEPVVASTFKALFEGSIDLTG